MFLGFDIFASDRFLIPFLATLGASLTIIVLQFIQRDRQDTDKKMYAISYMMDVCSRIIGNELMLNKHTIIPHIEAAKKIIKGDNGLLKTMFLADVIFPRKSGHNEERMVS